MIDIVAAHNAVESVIDLEQLAALRDKLAAMVEASPIEQCKTAAEARAWYRVDSVRGALNNFLRLEEELCDDAEDARATTAGF